jgi:hypothetical protein
MDSITCSALWGVALVVVMSGQFLRIFLRFTRVALVAGAVGDEL